VIKVLVVDDHAIVRRGLKQIISEAPDIEFADEAGDWQEALNLLMENDYDVAVLDISLPGRSGMDLLKEIRSQKLKARVLILSMHPEGQYAVRALRAGASGYLTKESAPGELVAAIRKISSGGKYITSSLAEKLASELDADYEKPLHETLSDREYQVMCRIASGRSVKEIAEEMFLSPKTISTYRTRILEKMNMNNNSDLTRYVIENKLVE
jgi:two-component system invasion response regulator UvrY